MRPKSRACSQSSQPDESTREMNERQERLGEFVIARGDASELLEMSEHALDAITVPITAEIAGYLLATIGLGRDDRQNALHQQLLANGITIISFVGQQRLRLGDGYRHQGIDRAIVRCFAARQDEAKRTSLIVAAGVDLARKAAA